ncbi:hypothetical protein [Pyruvatibacter sp.]|uniref:hypothetical protein n=1 Tax=Pyruvatibacter sp. TaxID=1981328 RepID=UPI0032EFFC02
MSIAAVSGAWAEDATVTLPEGQTSATITIDGTPTVVSTGDTIDAASSIGTGSSEIEVTLSDGSIIAVTPGTVFTFSVSASGVPTVTLTSGSARAVSNTSSSFAIATPDGSQVSGTDVAARVNTDGTVDFGSKSGDAVLATSTGGTTTIPAGTSVKKTGTTVSASTTPLNVGRTTLVRTAGTTPATTPTTPPTTTPPTVTIANITVVENALQDTGDGSPQTP